MEEVSTGLPGVFITVGDHVCTFFRGDEERNAVLFPYLTTGLASGDRCVCVLDRQHPQDVVEEIVVDAEQLDNLSLVSSEESYLTNGYFSPDEMLGYWAEVARATFDGEEYEFLRLAGEMTWALKDHPGVDLLVNYESELNRFAGKYPQTILCLYDLELFNDGELLIDILRTHPKVLMGGTIVENPWYTEPDQFLPLGQ